jgi:hypothetical protein
MNAEDALHRGDRRIVLAHLSVKPGRDATPHHAGLAGALNFVADSRSFNARNERPPTREKSAATTNKRGH